MADLEDQYNSENQEKWKAWAKEYSDNCTKKGEASKEGWQECMGTASLPLMTVACGGNPACAAVAAEGIKLAVGVIYDIGVELGFSNKEEEARKHAEQSAAWSSFSPVWDQFLKLDQEAGNALEAAKAAVAELRQEQGLPPQDFPFPQKPNLQTSKFYASVGLGPGNSSPSANAVVSMAWKKPAEDLFKGYAFWFSMLSGATKKAMLDGVAERAAQLESEGKLGMLSSEETTLMVLSANIRPKEKPSYVAPVAASAAVGIAIWWFLA